MPQSYLTYDITIPVLNEEKRLTHGVNTLLDYLKSNKMNHFTVTIADNGSTDKTNIIAKDLVAKNSILKYISVGRRGVGLALKTAWDQSKADIIGYLDVDLATDLHHLQEVFSLFEQPSIDIVNASRNLPLSKVINRSLIRNITSYGYNQILQFMLKVHFTDGMCGFKFLRNAVYQQLKPQLTNDGWFFCTELLYLSEKNGFLIHEIPVKWTDDQDSRVKLIKTITYYLTEIVKLRFRKLKVGNNG